MRSVVLVAGLMVGLVGRAQASARLTAQARAAQLAVLAKLTPTICPDIDTDESAVSALMARANLREKDLATRYRTATVAAVRALRRSAARDRDDACALIAQHLGEAGYRLLDEADPSED